MKRAEMLGTLSPAEKRLARALRERESVIENYVVQKAKTLGYISRKMNGLGFRAWPDRLFIHENGVLVWCEFKRPGEAPTPDQKRIHIMLHLRRQDVQVFDNREMALLYLKKRASMLAASGTPKRTNARR